jgi:Amt family ammonium transporter
MLPCRPAGILAGLVAITAPCSTCTEEGAFLIGLVAAPVYKAAAMLLRKAEIDDVVNAFPVHGACGCWGVLAAGLFATEHNYNLAYYASRGHACRGLLYGGTKVRTPSKHRRGLIL